MTIATTLPAPCIISVSVSTTAIIPAWLMINPPTRRNDMVLVTKLSIMSNSSKKLSMIKLPIDSSGLGLR